MQLSDLQSLVGSLTSDPNHDRYSLSDINTELDNAQNQWNVEIKIIRVYTAMLIIAGQYQYAFLGSVGKTVIAMGRATFKGIEMKKRSKAYFDLYSGGDWTLDQGTPSEYCIEATDAVNLLMTVHPTPQGNDAGINIAFETVVAHTPMSAATDTPFQQNSGVSDSFLRPYDFYLAYNVAARLLARDPSDLNNARAGQYLKISQEGKADLIQVFKALETEEPKRMSGGRYWNYGNSLFLK